MSKLRIIGIGLGVFTSLLLNAAIAQTMPPLVEAAKEGDWSRLVTLLDGAEDVNQAYGDGSTALHWASYRDNLQAAQTLIQAGARVDVANDLGVTPLWLAAENASSAMTGLLLEAGAEPDEALLSGETPLLMAALTGNADVVRQLLVAGANPDVAVTRGQTALMWAAGERHGEVVRVLLEHGADVHARTEIRDEYVKTEKEQDSHPIYKIWIEEGGYTPLLFAARSGALDSARYLVQAGADVDMPSAYGTTPLVMAVHGGNEALVDYLLRQGADVNAAPAGHTALHAAVLRGSLPAVESLLEHGADPDALLTQPTPTRRQATDYNFHDSLVGATSLWLAARFTEPEIMRALLEAGADPGIGNHVVYPAQDLGDNFMQDEGEISVLMAAVGMGNRRLRVSWGTPERRAGQLGQEQEERILEATQVALAAGVDVGLLDAEGQSALDFARARRYSSVVAYLEGVIASTAE